MVNFENRLEAYKQKYGVENRQNSFSYNQSAEQIVYRNEALRTANRELYISYLKGHEGLDVAKELRIYDSLAHRVLKLNTASFLAWAIEKGIELVESDIFIFDEDAILKGIRAEDAERNRWDIEDSWKELIHNLHVPYELAKERDYFWVIDE